MKTSEPKAQKTTWSECKWKVRTFIADDDPVCIHIVKSGVDDKYFVIWDDAYQEVFGKVDIRTKEEIKEIFEIDIEEII